MANTPTNKNLEQVAKSWKQPIPTNLEELTDGNVFTATLFAELLRRCANAPMEIQVGDSWVRLERGQCIVGQFELAKHFGLKKNESQRIRNALVRIEKVNKLINKRKSRNCSIVTVLNYDRLTQFEQSNDRDRHTSKTYQTQQTRVEESVKTGKKEKLKENEQLAVNDSEAISPLWHCSLCRMKKPKLQGTRADSWRDMPSDAEKRAWNRAHPEEPL